MADLGPQHGGQADQYYQDAQQEQYKQQPPPDYAHNYGAQPSTSDGKLYTFDQAFKLDPGKPKWNDIWAGVLFLIVFGGYIATSGIALEGYDAFNGFNGGGIYNAPNRFSPNTNTVVLFAFVCVVALVLSWVYMLLARMFTKQFIWITGILNIVFAFVTAIYMLVRKYWSGGIVFLIFAVITVFFFISWIPRIPFSVVMLQTTIDVSKKYGHVYLVSLISGLLATAFGAWYSLTLVAIYAKYEPGDQGEPNPACAAGNGGCSTGKVIGLIVFVTFAMYWISEWLKNTTHTIVSGVYGSWYFCVNNFPKNATRGAFRRAMTYSFGSISFGSLIVAIINMLRQACSIAQNQARSEGNLIGTCLFCLLQCFISLLDWAVQFVNRFAFTHIALYGKAYIPAAKDAWKVITSRGIDILVNDCLVGPVLTFGATFVAYACGLLSYLYLVYTAPAYNANGDFTPVVVAFAFLVGLQICHVFTMPLGAGIDALFVAMAWDPEVLMRDHPDLYSKVVATYPRVQEMIHA